MLSEIKRTFYNKSPFIIMSLLRRYNSYKHIFNTRAKKKKKKKQRLTDLKREHAAQR